MAPDLEFDHTGLAAAFDPRGYYQQEENQHSRTIQRAHMDMESSMWKD